MIFYVTYYRPDKKLTETRHVKAKTMIEAVEIIVKDHDVEISKISCKIDGCHHQQFFCDNCKINYAMFSHVEKHKGKIRLCVNCKKG